MKRESLKKLCESAKRSSEPLALVSSQDKNRALRAMAKAFLRGADRVIRENQKDLKAARAGGLAQSLIARLTLDKAKIKKIANSLVSIAGLPDPVGRVISSVRRPNGLVIKKVRVPIGVILIIYEARPNVTADCMALCLKSGNSVILKGGSEAFHSNGVIFRILSEAAARCGIPKGVFQFITTRGRSAVKSLLGFSQWIDLVIPRGGEGLIQHVAKISRIPVIKHTQGVCHVFVDKKANLEKSENIVVNAKVQNPAVCNAMETLLVHEAAASKFIPRICRVLGAKGVQIRGDEKTRRFFPGIRKATQKDWTAEYLDLVLSVKVVKDLDEAIRHIQKYGSHHSDAIVTQDKKAAAVFTDSVDSACVFVNSSTRFHDGGEFGMGAEMGISTDKLHARGPMGLEELTSYKYVVLGSGQVRG
ncbi:MAG: glutamate-5-semialdehyde dehydrogenase [Omnitrophica bacterium RIFCSPHIGHO2_02_FULL_51_18]|nr:MAG: glutamate-5-semialdehyde dehydrogenase [Omnitrophica bacterium RIFCSPHIGHO2_02_FULL_51_18]